LKYDEMIYKSSRFQTQDTNCEGININFAKKQIKWEKMIAIHRSSRPITITN